MYRKTIAWSAPPSAVRPRKRTGSADQSASATSGETLETGSAALAELRKTLQSLGAAVEEIEQRRRQSLGELQQVALELAIAVASHVIAAAIQQNDYGIEQLVQRAVDRLGLASPPTIFLHPADLDLLRRRLGGQPPPFREHQLDLKPDVSVARGGFRAETADGRILVSDISSRLSDIRRHWMEELDDAQIERRRAAGAGGALRRFPDRRETA